MDSSTLDDNVYITLEHLIAMEYKAKGFSFLPRQPIHSLLSGRHASRMRGRGLNFEELRGYLAGDDIRTIDWKVTARTGEPYVRVYTEERDRPAFVMVDQRLSMFFGSQKYMKSVIAAKLAALVAWRVFKVGDRIGAAVFNDSRIQQVRPHRSKSTVMQQYGVRGIPATFIVDPQGIVRKTTVGYSAGMEKELEQAIVPLLPR